MLKVIKRVLRLSGDLSKRIRQNAKAWKVAQ